MFMFIFSAEMFDDDNSGEVDFQEFLSGLSLIIRGDTQAKLKFAFRIYDNDNDGFISNGELYQVVHSCINITPRLTKDLLLHI